MSSPLYDVTIVGAGPAGSTTAYFLLKHNPNLRVALLDKETFPRDKFCGDAWCAPALEILEEMGVLQRLEAKGLVSETLAGGFVSPSGYSFIANDKGTPAAEKNMSTRAYAIKRMICDEAIARRAAEMGAHLKESHLVTDATWDPAGEIWTVRCTTTATGVALVRSRFLVCSDGSASNTARRLGIVRTAPDGVAARQYVKGGTHNFKADGVLLYPEYTLPGYMALFRHYDDSIDLGAYLLPGGAAKESDIARIYSETIRTDPFISRALGDKWEPLERVRVASLRLGGVPESYGHALLIVGDAAGQIDPLTGEGIHTAMIAAKIAAKEIVRMLSINDLSRAQTKRYHDLWWRDFGKDFPLSAAAGKAVYKAPFLMDAVPIAAAAKGTGKAATAFFADFGAVMTGVKPKSTFLMPGTAWPLAKATFGIILGRITGRIPRTYFQDPFLLLDAEMARTTSWDAQCLIDPTMKVGREISAEAKVKAIVDGMLGWSGDKTTTTTMKNVKVRRVLVGYGTEYGFSQHAAVTLCDALATTLGFNGTAAGVVVVPRLINLEHFKLIDWSKETHFLVVCSTTGDGEIPVESREFFASLKEESGDVASRNFLKHVKIAVLAPGDSGYPRFCEAGRELGRLLKSRGASEMLPTTDLDCEKATVVEKWISDVVSAIKSELGATTNGGVEHAEDYLEAAAKQAGASLIKEPRATRTDPCLVKVKSRVKLTDDAHCEEGEDKWHIVLDSSLSNGLLKYESGDALGVLPENDPAEVSRLMELLAFAERNEKEEAASKLRSEKNLKDLGGEAMIELVGGAGEKRDDEWLSDWLRRVRAGKAPLEKGAEFINSMSDLKPRFYSIASSPEKDAGEIHLCVAAVRYRLDGGKGRKAQGVATGWLCDRLSIGDMIKTFVQRNPDFKPGHAASLAKGVEADFPKIMVGPGTGIAPFRSFWRSEKRSRRDDPGDRLYFGCRKSRGDFLYRDEMREANFPYHLKTAFSRDQKEKIYVQDELRKDAKEIWRLLKEKGGKVFICGDGAKMARDVEECLICDVCMKAGGVKSREEAERFVRERTEKDVWIV